MKKLKFKKFDAFATANSSGNPAGCVQLNSMSELNDDQMLKIAKELKGFVTEVGYISDENFPVYDLKYFSSEREVDFCGHATIAILYDLIKNDPKLIEQEVIKIRTRKGILEVENQIKKENSVFVMAPKPVFIKNSLSADVIAKELNISVSEIDKSLDISIINAGLATLIIPILSLKSILNISPDLETLNIFCRNNNIDIIEVFCKEVTNPMSDYRTRVFAPTYGYIEDPATGSGNSAFGYYLIERKMFNKSFIVIEQNGFEKNYNIVKLKKSIDAGEQSIVYFGGNGINKISGYYYL